MTESQYTWIPLYKELAQKLLKWESRQAELIELIESLRAENLTVTTMTDKDADGQPFLMKELDPFTFFGIFNRGITEDNRIEILKRLKDHFGCKSDVPTDFVGVPLLNNMKSWFVAFSFRRSPDDVSTLWQVFRLAQKPDPINDPEFAAAYDSACAILGVSNNLTMGLFWIRPDLFLSMESKNRDYLNLPNNVAKSASGYLAALSEVRESHTESLPEISYKAHLASIGQNATEAGKAKTSASGATYWFVGAYWKSQDPKDQTPRFIEEGIWQNGFKDKHLDVVRSMAVGDRIAIKSTHTQKYDLPFEADGNTVSKMAIRAIGTITGNRDDGKTVDVEWDKDWQAKDWYFFTYQRTIWKLTLDDDYRNKEYAERLIQFAFFGASQDIDWFLERWYGEDDPVTDEDVAPETVPYGIDDIIADGAFMSEGELQMMLSRLELKKNIILQGPPGVGKTFLARRLAFALLEETAAERTRLVQFHQSYSYEDFVRGYRPQMDTAGAFGLQNGVFFEFCEEAREDPDRDYVLMIDEINRGNLSQIFGELLMLIEADKRQPEYAMRLLYPLPDEPDFYIPENLHIIGMMNLADRSLALVDYALRRRFAFASLTARFESSEYRDWLLNNQMKPKLADLIIHRLTALNKQIADDNLLGPNYEVGHSFFCPKGDNFAGLGREWYDAVIETEVVPLLREYWFDNAAKAEEAREQLLGP